VEGRTSSVDMNEQMGQPTLHLDTRVYSCSITTMSTTRQESPRKPVRPSSLYQSQSKYWYISRTRTHLLYSCNGKLERLSCFPAVKRCILIIPVPTAHQSHAHHHRIRTEDSQEALFQSLPPPLHRSPHRSFLTLHTSLPGDFGPLLQLLQVLHQTNTMPTSQTSLSFFIQVLPL
jgi:hypothetical protein